MSKFVLTDWEINGYDDSDFMLSYYDDVTNSIGTSCYGSTRYPSSHNIGINADGTTSVTIGDDILKLPNAEVVEKARLVLEEYIFQTLTAAEKGTVERPNVKDLREGLRLRLAEDARMQVREHSPCQKCGGSGKWVNPRNDNDKRDCFSCRGTGQWAGDKAKDENGKQKWEKLPAGLSGVVVKWSSFGQFYANGYNQPDRHNTSVQLRTDEGKVVRASLSKLRLDREVEAPEMIRQKAKELSFNYQFSKFYPRHAWDSRNFAAEVAKPPIHG